MKIFTLFTLTLLVTLGFSSEKDEISQMFKTNSVLEKYLSPLGPTPSVYSKDLVDTLFGEYMEEREKIISKDKSLRFTKDVPSLTPDEEVIDAYLKVLRGEMIHEDDSPLLLDFYDGQAIIKDSEAHDFFLGMPKGGHMHVHIEASIAMKTFISFTYNDFVYFNIDTQELKTAPNGMDEEGFLKCNDLRRNWNLEGTFDEYLTNLLLLQPEDISSKQSHEIWKAFQPKFALNDAVIHYYEFYRQGLLDYYRQAVDEGVFIAELRHASGIIFDENHNFLSLQEEFDLYKSVIDEIKKENPDFQMTVIVVAFKVLGKEHVMEQLESYLYAMDHGYDFITGFDLVNEEEFTEPISHFAEDMIKAKVGYPDFNFYFHSGESSDRNNENLYDAILLGTKRIGHGINIVLHPHLVDLVVEKNIGYEICPISNLILGYTLDMRWHPARELMARGVPVTISSDDPTFWNYRGISLDFTYAFLAWDLDLKDIKQLAINSIHQSSIKDDIKPKMLEKFYNEWDDFISDFSKKADVLSKLAK
ncbi:unnamed protein product [Moneuplotes crassus]|uniref:Adenosine deaminase domain-containing protein n=1 Tax=Euplotes crassus TaxID=5936 RepID=A0AAD1UAD5_EUPCR|nr:unnamed protein product [Moneuplotes crassus]